MQGFNNQQVHERLGIGRKRILELRKRYSESSLRLFTHSGQGILGNILSVPVLAKMLQRSVVDYTGYNSRDVWVPIL